MRFYQNIFNIVRSLYILVPVTPLCETMLKKSNFNQTPSRLGLRITLTPSGLSNYETLLKTDMALNPFMFIVEYLWRTGFGLTPSRLRLII